VRGCGPCVARTLHWRLTRRLDLMQLVAGGVQMCSKCELAAVLPPVMRLPRGARSAERGLRCAVCGMCTVPSVGWSQVQSTLRAHILIHTSRDSRRPCTYAPHGRHMCAWHMACDPYAAQGSRSRSRLLSKAQGANARRQDDASKQGQATPLSTIANLSRICGCAAGGRPAGARWSVPFGLLCLRTYES
jgi:hypothetical protein